MVLYTDLYRIKSNWTESRVKKTDKRKQKRDFLKIYL